VTTIESVNSGQCLSHTSLWESISLSCCTGKQVEKHTISAAFMIFLTKAGHRRPNLADAARVAFVYIVHLGLMRIFSPDMTRGQPTGCATATWMSGSVGSHRPTTVHGASTTSAHV
jgi:hypothetical protein